MRAAEIDDRQLHDNQKSNHGGAQDGVASVNAANMQMSPNTAEQLLNSRAFLATAY